MPEERILPMQPAGFDVLLSGLFRRLMGGSTVERIKPGVLQVTQVEFGADILYEEIQRLSSRTLGESADFCGRSEASITMAVSMSEETQRRFLDRAGGALTRIWLEAGLAIGPADRPASPAEE
ncbi:hypothetical protein [Nocardia sp. NPDC050710]|uniref:hypothetical protein n=1 Tax=Nocardia sp. NPDC050710 TaxID=3157220 RepID=UPI0033CE4834